MKGFVRYFHSLSIPGRGSIPQACWAPPFLFQAPQRGFPGSQKVFQTPQNVFYALQKTFQMTQKVFCAPQKVSGDLQNVFCAMRKMFGTVQKIACMMPKVPRPAGDALQPPLSDHESRHL